MAGTIYKFTVAKRIDSTIVLVVITTAFTKIALILFKESSYG